MTAHEVEEMKQSVTARGRVLPSSRWIFLALVGTFVLALSGSALAETPEGSTAAATQVRTWGGADYTPDRCVEDHDLYTVVL